VVSSALSSSEIGKFLKGLPASVQILISMALQVKEFQFYCFLAKTTEDISFLLLAIGLGDSMGLQG